MQRNGEDVILIFASCFHNLGAHLCRRDAWKWPSAALARREDGGSTIAIVNVAIHGHCAADFSQLLNLANGNGNIVNHAKTFAVVGMSMMESAADIYAYSHVQSALRCQDRTTCRQPKSFHKLWRVGKLHLKLFLRTDLAA